ncbi:MAG: MBL fold metallo-hydrolase [Deltaproteobacteria bacterium]|nr:MBL fold metallo-hydrolase [Deltaproteobacteria bacterium]MBW2416471.1 MBL fold metallo-hydrolase [Deltaproteobacteria bacterium]
MNVTLWGTRGSLAAPGPETMRYGGNTSCVEVRAAGRLLVLDAGTGIRRLGDTIERDVGRVDVLLTHLHMDHIQGLGFFEPLFWPDCEVHVWGPSSTTMSLHDRLTRYLSPPLFPVRLRDLACNLQLHDVVPLRSFSIGEVEIQTRLVCHPGPTVGYRIECGGASMTYLPDHEPALGAEDYLGEHDWIPGIDLAEGVDLLIHDAQWSAEEYPRYVGWGHSSLPQALDFAAAAGVKKLIPFHHDPTHSDEMLDRLFDEQEGSRELPFELVRAAEGAVFRLPGG